MNLGVMSSFSYKLGLYQVPYLTSKRWRVSKEREL
jgi:hypothetical protein